MKKIIIATLLLALVPSLNLYSQKVDSWEKSAKDKKATRKFSNNFFMSGGITPFLGFHKYTFESSNGEDPYNRSDFGIIRGELGFRYNVFNYKDFLSISVSAYPEASLRTGEVAINALSFPIGIDVNLFNSSTYNNIDKAGLSIGFGRNFDFGPDYRLQSNYLRGVVRYDKYSRKFKKGMAMESKLISGYFGVDFLFAGAQEFGEKDLINYRGFQIVLGRTFGL
jgi:hypothetical protein